VLLAKGTLFVDPQGRIQANGGNGGNGVENGTVMNSEGEGGGGGGGGGIIHLLASSLSGFGTVQVLGGTAGTSGTLDPSRGGYGGVSFGQGGSGANGANRPPQNGSPGKLFLTQVSAPEDLLF
jgi:hypothetical protein